MIDLTISLYDIEYFLLIFTRVSCFVFVAPFFSMSNTPARVRVGLSFLTAALLYQVLSPADAVIVDSELGYALVVVKEAVTGLLIGFASNMCVSIVNFAGSVADMEIGLSMMQLLDPLTRQNTTITGVLYQYMFFFFMILSGMYRYLLGALADSFRLIPVNGAVFHSDKLMTAMLTFLADYVMIGFRIILPIFCVMLLLNAVLGVLAKVAPQMNMFAVGIQLKIVVGLSVLFLTITMLPDATEFIFDKMKTVTEEFVDAMLPTGALSP